MSKKNSISKEKDSISLNKKEYQDYILLKKSDIVDLIENGREHLGDNIQILEAIYKWIESKNRLNANL